MQAAIPVSFVGDRQSDVGLVGSLGQGPHGLALHAFRGDAAERVHEGLIDDPTPKDGRRGKTRLAPDEQGAGRPSERGCEVVQCGFGVLRLEPKDHRETEVGVVVAPALMRSSVCVGPTSTTDGPSSRAPSLVSLRKLSSLVVGEPTQRGVGVVDGPEHDSLLEILVLRSHRPRPPQRVGQHSGEHGTGRKIPCHPVGVYGFAPKRSERGLEAHVHPARHLTAPSRRASPAQFAKSGNDNLTAPGIAAPLSVMTLLASPLP